MEAINVEIILTEEELTQHKDELEQYVKNSLAMQIAKRLADSELGLQRYTNMRACKWAQCVYVFNEEQYLELTSTTRRL